MRNLNVRLVVSGLAAFRSEIGAAGNSVQAMGRDISSASTTSRAAFANIGKAGVIAGGLIVAGFGAAIAQAAKFERSMRNVATISQATRDDFNGMSQAVLELSRKVPQAATTLADGLYDIASSGFDGAEALAVLETSAIAATAGMTDTATAARAVTGVLNAYGDGAEDAKRVSDVLFQTVNLGVISFEELAQNVGDYVSTAAALGVSFEETASAMATMTLAGISGAESATALNRVMSSFIKPSDEMKGALAELGYESGTAAVEALGLKGAVELINEHANGSVTAIAGMYGEVRAIKGALALTAAEGENYARITDGIATATDGAGASQRAYAEQSKTFLVQLDLAKSSLQAVAIEIGTRFLPFLTSAAQVVGGLADAFGNLSSPAQTAVVAFTGMAGVVSLLGGAALIALPKIIEMRTAFLELATAPGTSTAMTRGLTGLAGAMGMIGRMGAVGAVLGAVSIGIDALSDSLADAKGLSPGVEALAISLGRLAGSGGSDAGRAAAEVDKLAAAFNRANDAAHDLGGADWNDWGANVDAFWGAVTGKNPEIEANKNLIEDYDAALAQLFEQDPEAGAAAYQELWKALHATGLSSTEIADRLPKAAAALNNGAAGAEAAKEDFERLKAELAATGIELDETSELVAATTEELGKLKGATDPLIFAMAAAGEVTVEQAEAMQDALEEFVDSVEDSFGAVANPMTAYADELERVNERGAKANETFVARTELSNREYLAGLERTAGDARAFMDDLHAAIEAGYDPAFVADLMAAGPETAAPILATLLRDTSATNVEQVNNALGALRQLNQEAVEMARLTHLATTGVTDDMSRDLDAAMTIAQMKMARGADLTVGELTRRLGKGAGEVRDIAARYGIELEGGLNSYMVKISGMQVAQHYQEQDRARTNRNAMGDIKDGHQPEIAPGGAWRLWAEPETQGEAYIPLANDHRRGRAVDIWEETGRRLGQFAAGGFNSVASIPRPPNVSRWGTAVGGAGARTMDVEYGEAVELIAKRAAAANLGAGGSAPGVQRMMAALHQVFPGLALISGLRPGAITATGKPSYHGQGRAVDIPPRMDVFNWLASNYGNSRELIFSPAGGRQINNGRPHVYTGITKAMHYDHIHWAMAKGGILNPHVRDAGGPLHPGYTYNGTGRPEVVIPHALGGITGGAVRTPGGTAAMTLLGLTADNAAVEHLLGELNRRAHDLNAIAHTSATAIEWITAAEGKNLEQLPVFSAAWDDKVRAIQRFSEEAGMSASDLLATRQRFEDNLHEMGVTTTAEYVAQLDRRIAREQVFSDEWVALVKQRTSILEEEARANADLADEMHATFDRMFELGDVDLATYVTHLDNRMAAEARHSAQWTTLYRQRESAIERAAAAERQAAQDFERAQEEHTRAVESALSDLNRLLEQEADIRQRISDGIADHGRRQLELQKRLAADEARIIDDRSDRLLGWADAEQRYTEGWANSAGALTANISRQVEAFTAWAAELDAARARGLSEQTIDLLGLAEGPKALAQLRQINSATTSEVDALNAAVGARFTQATSRARVEAGNATSEVGRALADIARRHQEAVDEATETFLRQQQQLTTDLHNIGISNGLSYGDALARGLDSSLAGVRAAADRLRQAAAAPLTLPAAPPAPTPTARLPSLPAAPVRRPLPTSAEMATWLWNIASGTSTFDDFRRHVGSTSVGLGADADAAAKANSAEAIKWRLQQIVDNLPKFGLGTASVPGTGAQLAFVHGGERIISPTDNRALTATLEQLAGRVMTPPAINIVVNTGVEGLRAGEVEIIIGDQLRRIQTGDQLSGSR